MVPECPTPLLGRDILSKLGTTLVMGSFSAPRTLQLLVTTEEPITPSIERDQKLWEDEINPQVWDQGIPGRAHQAEPVIIVLRDPTRFPNWKQNPGLLHWQIYSLLLSHQGSPIYMMQHHKYLHDFKLIYLLYIQLKKVSLIFAFLVHFFFLIV